MSTQKSSTPKAKEVTNENESSTPKAKEVTKYGKDDVAVRVWQPGFNQDTGEIINKPYVHTSHRSDWENQVAPLGDSKTSTLEHIGLHVVEVLHLPESCTQPNINEKYVTQLKERGVI